MKEKLSRLREKNAVVSMKLLDNAVIESPRFNSNIMETNTYIVHCFNNSSVSTIFLSDQDSFQLYVAVDKFC